MDSLPEAGEAPPQNLRPWTTPVVIVSKLAEAEMPAFITHTDTTIVHGNASQS